MRHLVYIAVTGDEKISIWAVDPTTGLLQLQEDISVGGAPGPLAVDPEQRRLYAGLRSTSELASYRIEQTTGSLVPIRSISLEADPCYLAIDRTGRFVLSAYYRAGLVAVHRINSGGAAVGPPVEWLPTAEKAHSIQTDASNRYAFVPHVGESNVVFQFCFDDRTGRLTPNRVPKVVPEPGLGPRHFCFHPSGRWVYFVNEQGCSVTAYRLDRAAGTLTSLQTLSTLPTGYSEPNTCAQIHIAPSGRFLYAANRGHDSIACFSIDADTGRLRAIGQRGTEHTPRAFGIDPDGQYLYAAGLGSGRLAAYRVDQDSGALSPVASYAIGERPMWVLVLKLMDADD
jgi:6-phosphogluconolactonase